MKEGWTARWKALLVWLCGYLSIIAFAIAGGYVIVKSDNEELKRTTKQAFIVTLVFTLISMFFAIYSSIGTMFAGFYGSDAYIAYNVLLQLTEIAKIIVFVVFGALAFFKGNYGPEKTEEKKEPEKSADDELKI